MDFVTSKAMLVAVGVFVTIIITSGIFVILGYVLDIYGNIAKLDYASLAEIDEFSRYNVTIGDGTNGTLYGYEILNMINKYKNDSEVEIVKQKGTTPEKNKDETLSAKYFCKVEETTTSTGALVKITYWQ